MIERPSQLIDGFLRPSSTTTHLVGMPLVPRDHSVLASLTNVPELATACVQPSVAAEADISHHNGPA